MLDHHQRRSEASPLWLVLTLLTAMLGSGCGRAADSTPTVNEINDAFQDVKSLVREGRIEEAVHKYEEVLLLADKLPENKDGVLADGLRKHKDGVRALILHDIGILCLENGNYDNAKSCLEESLMLREGKSPEQDAQILETMLALAKTYSLMGDFEKAEALFARTERALKATVGPDDPSLAIWASSFADLYKSKGDFEKAEALLVRALDIYRRTLPSDHRSILLAQIILTDLYRLTARYDEALALCDTVLRAARASEDVNKIVTPRILNVKAKVLSDAGRHQEAKQVFEECLAIQTQQLGPNHPDVAVTLGSLAAIAEIAGDYVEAARYYERSLRIMESTLGRDHFNVGITLGNMAVLYRKMGDYEKAVAFGQKGMDICTKTLGDDHPQTAAISCTVASMLHEVGRLKDAEALLIQSWYALRKSQGSDSPMAALVWAELAAVYEDMGDMAKAEQMYERSLGIRASQFGLNDPDAVDGLNNLGLLYFRNGKPDRAESMFEAALRNAERTLGRDHPKVAVILNNVAVFQESRGRLHAAIEAADRARRIVRQHLPGVLCGLSLAEQVQFQELNDYEGWDSALSIAFAHPDNANAARHSASWVLNGKALKASVLAERARLLAEGHDRKSAELARELAGMDRVLAALLVNGPKADERQCYVSRLAALEKSREQLFGELGYEMRGSLDSGEWVTLENVQECLTDDAALVEIVRAEPLNLRAERGQQRLPSKFVAWLITDDTSKPPTIVDLGEASRIESAIQDVRTTLQNAHADIEAGGEPRAEAKLQAKIERLSDLVIAPLSRHLADKPVWLVSPDGALWLVPWEMLMLDGKYVIEDHTVTYLTSGRELLSKPDNRVPQVPVVVADPDFDAAVDVQERTDVVEGTTPGHQNRAGIVDMTKLRLVKWPRLPGTREEARRIISALSNMEGNEVTALLGEDAQEGEFKRRVRRPRVLVASTHGFFVPNVPRTRPNPSGDELNGDRGIGGILGEGQGPGPEDDSGLHRIVANNPLLQCGLVLAGANKTKSMGERYGEDGILTGLEAASLHLSGTELVILSACDTGVGKIHVGDGVASLRQSFLVAGADAVVATLWKVPDRETADLVGDLVDGFARDQSVSSALRRAQLNMISKRRKAHGAAHPLFWASFTNTGHWRYPNRFQYQELQDRAWRFEERWPDGSPKVRCEMKATDRGLLLEHGGYTRWYRDGQKYEEGQFVAGKREGTWAKWHENGVMASEKNYSGGVLSGPFVQWNSKGEKIREGQFVDGEWSGKIIAWHTETGQWLESQFKTGREHGLSVLYSKDGVKVCERHYKNGLLHGTSTYWHDNGKKYLEVEYSDGVELDPERTPEQ